MKRILSILLSVSLIAVIMPHQALTADSLFIINTDFESETAGTDPSGFTLGEGGGNIEVKELYNNKAVLIENTRDGRYTTLKKEFGTTYSNIPLAVEMSYMQKSVKNDGVVILAVGREQEPIVTLETESGNIVYRSGGITRITIVENYLANRWYDLKIRIDLLKKTADVFLSNTMIAENLPVSDYKADYFSSYTCYSPGHYVDNIRIYTSQEQGSIKLKGPDKISIPKTGERSYTYTAAVLDSGGIEIEGAAVDYMFAPVSGIQASIDGNTLILKVTDSAAATRFDIFVKSRDDASVNYTMTVDLTEDALNNIKIQGPARICWRKEDSNQFLYKAALLNSTADEMEGNVTWSLEGNVPPEVTIDPEKGIITTGGKLDRYRNSKITLKATSKENPLISKSLDIMLLDWKTCMEDNDRVNILTEFLDEILKLGADRWNGTPLISDGYNTLTDMPYEWPYPTTTKNPAPAVLSDLASQGNLMRMMDGIGNWIYDDKYKDRVDEIHRYYVDHYLSPANSLPYWGGHAAVDLRTGTPNEAEPDVNTHELKDNFVYLDAFGRVDPSLPLTIAQSVWSIHIKDFNTFDFNRHGSFTAKPELSWWNSEFDDEAYRPELVPTLNCGFRLAANDFLYIMAEAYKTSGDVNALKWARRLWKKFADVCDENTGLGGYMFTTAYGAPGVKEFPDPIDSPEWIKKILEYNSVYTWTTYGDRAYVQFKDEVVRKGLMTEEEAENQCREANAMFGTSYMEFSAQPVEFILVDELNNAAANASAEEKLLLENWVKEIENYNLKRLSNYAKIAYNPNTDKVKPIWANGVDMTGFIVERPGYYYNRSINYVMREESVTDSMFLAYLTVFSKTAHRTDKETERRIIWETLRNMAEKRGLGDWGEYGSTNPGVNLSTTNQTPMNSIIASYLYETTGNGAYLDLARKIAENIIDAYYHNRIFKDSTSYKNIRWCGKNDAMPYSLYLLEHAIRGTLSSVTYYCPNGAQFTADIIEEYTGRFLSKRMSAWNAWAVPLDSVKVKSIKTDEQEYFLSQNEERKIKVTIYPDDAENKTVNWYNQNPSVARFNSETNTLTAYTKGETILTGFSGDRNTFVKFKVIVK